MLVGIMLVGIAPVGIGTCTRFLVRRQEDEMKVTEMVRRVVEGSAELYCVESHVHVRCSDTSVYAPVNNIFVEKLDRHVVISSPDFMHQPQSVQQAR